MNNDLHVRAEQLMAQERVEGILLNADRAWLAQHLRECEQCAGVGEETERLLASLRATRVELPLGLAGRTQMRVRLHAGELQERTAGTKLVWAISGISWALGVATAPWVWRGFAWIGAHTGAPALIWQAGFLLWWAIPAMFAAGAVLANRKKEFGQELD